MSQPLADETHALPPSFGLPTLPSHLVSNGEPQVLAGPSIEKPYRLDHEFNFQIVVFEVENTLFQVLRNAFIVPETIFEAMFALPQTQKDSFEGSSLENPIHLPGIKADHFRSFLRILYPFIGQKPVDGFDEWVGVLNLATMWLQVFQEIRAKAITKLSNLIEQKTVMERVALAREYRVAGWLRDAYLELIQKTPLDFEELRPAESYSESNPLDRNWETDAKKWEATSRDWETLARISNLQTKVATTIISFGAYRHQVRCEECGMDYGVSNLCKCDLLVMVHNAFRGEWEIFRENPGHVDDPLPLPVTPIRKPASTHYFNFDSDLE